MSKANWLTGIFVLALLAAGRAPRALFGQPSEPSPVVETPLAPTLVDPTVSSTPMLIHVSESDRFSIQYPPTYTLYLDERPGVDGAMYQLPEDAIAILSPASPNFLLTVRHISLTQTPSVEEFATEWACGDLDFTAGQEVLIGDQMALLFPNLACGPYGSSMLFLVHGNDGYLMTMETHQMYADVSDAVMEVISTFQYLGTSP